MTGKEVLKTLQDAGWVVDRINGSHHVLKRDGQTLVVPVHGKRDLPPGTLNAILKKAGLK